MTRVKSDRKMKTTIAVRLNSAEFFEVEEDLEDIFFLGGLSFGKLMIRFDSAALELGEFGGLIGKRVEWRGEDGFC